MKTRSLSLMSLALIVCLSPMVLAQPGGGRGGQGGRGQGGFGGGRGGFSMGPTLELFSMLRMEEVRDEIGLDDEIYQAVQENVRIDFRSMFQMSEDERKEMMEETEEKACGLMDEVFEPNQQTRLMGLFAQQRGIRAIENKLISEKIELSESAMKKIK